MTSHSQGEPRQCDLGPLTPEFNPGRVFLFSGHMMDAPQRKIPRFPPEKELAAAGAIGNLLDSLGADCGDLGFTQGASGGDILFIEACQRRGVRVQLLLPLPEAEFVERSLLPSSAGEHWRGRFFAAKAKLLDPPRIMPPEPPPVPYHASREPADPFIRCNLWLLDTALSWGADRVHFICLWDGEGGDGRGGTAHICNEVMRRHGHVNWIDIRTLG